MTNTETLRRNIQDGMERLELTAKSLSVQSGLNATAVRDIMEERIKNPTYRTLSALARTLKCTVAELTGERPPQKSLPPVSPPDSDDIQYRGEEYTAVAVYDAHASAGPGALNSDHPEPLGYYMFRAEWLRTLSRSATVALAILMVAGDSMEPTLQNGDHIMIDTGVRHLGRDGLYVIAAENEVQVKRLSRDPRDRSVTIRSDNPKAESWTGVPEDQVHVLGRVLWLSRRVEG